MENKNSFYVDGLEEELQKYIELISHTNDEVIYKLVLNDKAFNMLGLFDEGLLIALIDSYSSFACFLIGKDTKQYSLSMNLKMTSIDNLKKNTDYYMKVKICDENKNTVLFDAQIVDSNGRLIKKASHFKKIVKPKF